jgi:hypothetical protein
VRVEDGNGGALEQVFTITVLDVDVPPTITSAAPGNGAYGTAYSHTFVATGEPAATFSVTGGTLPPGLELTAGGTLSGTPTQAGTFANITVTAANGAAPADTQSFTITITPAELTVTADPQTKVYGAALPALTFTASGFVNGEDASIITGALATDATATSPVGAYPITQGTLAAPNYTINFTGASLTVNPAPLTVTADNRARAFGEPNPELTFTVSGLVNGDTAATALTGALETTATVSSPVGPYPITQGTLAAPNYTISFTGANLNITPAALDVVADAKARRYGEANPALTVSVSGLVNGDTAATALTGALATDATATSPVGAYPIIQGTLGAPNYTISFTDGTLTVAEAVLEVTAGAQTKVYGAALPALTFTATGFANGEDVSIITGALATTATATSPVGVYPITQGTLAASNYTINFTGASLTVTPAELTVTANDQTMIAGDALPELTISYSGFVLGEDVGALATLPTATTAATSASPAGVYPITVSGGSAANYRLAYVDGTLTITPAPVEGPMQLYIPLVSGGVAAAPATEGPDLVVETITTTEGALAVVIANRGDETVVAPFWVDLAIAPRRAPEAVNDTWQMIGERGMSWGVITPIAPGERLTLTPGDRFYAPTESDWGEAIAAGTQLYAHVDSANTQTTYGGVLEVHERRGASYNNLLSATAASAIAPPAGPVLQAEPNAELPPRR